MTNKRQRTVVLLGVLFVLLLAAPLTAQAHVKWFADFAWSDQPATLEEVVDATFLGLGALSVAVIGTMVFLDRRLGQLNWYQAINDWIASYKEKSVAVLRIATGMTLLLSWQGDALLMPELEIPQAWVGWFQFALTLMLLSSRLTPFAGAGLFVLYGIGILEFGAFHMLDYIFIIGIGWFLIVSRSDNPRVWGTRIPALYFTVGFSLCWVALEKLIYPQWGLYILETNPQLSLGFDIEFFLVAAAFVEFALGYLLIINLLQRPLALVITLVFFTTTLVFGKVEVIGHLAIHAALIVFLIEGPGDVYKAPITFHRRLPMRAAFATVNFVLLLVVMILPYSLFADAIYEAESEQTAAIREVQPVSALPSALNLPPREP